MATSYELVHVSRSGHERVHPYASEEPLARGSVLHYEGRDWLVEGVDGLLGGLFGPSGAQMGPKWAPCMKLSPSGTLLGLGGQANSIPCRN